MYGASSHQVFRCCGDWHEKGIQSMKKTGALAISQVFSGTFRDFYYLTHVKLEHSHWSGCFCLHCSWNLFLFMRAVQKQFQFDCRMCCVRLGVCNGCRQYWSATSWCWQLVTTLIASACRQHSLQSTTLLWMNVISHCLRSVCLSAFQLLVFLQCVCKGLRM